MKCAVHKCSNIWQILGSNYPNFAYLRRGKKMMCRLLWENFMCSINCLYYKKCRTANGNISISNFFPNLCLGKKYSSSKCNIESNTMSYQTILDFSPWLAWRELILSLKCLSLIKMSEIATGLYNQSPTRSCTMEGEEKERTVQTWPFHTTFFNLKGNILLHSSKYVQWIFIANISTITYIHVYLQLSIMIVMQDEIHTACHCKYIL